MTIMFFRTTIIILGILLGFLYIPAFGQSDVLLLTRATGSLTACDSAKVFTVELTNTTGAPINAVTFRPRLQEGVEYVTGSASVLLGSGVTVAETSLLDLEDPVFTINTLPVGLTRIAYSARANCTVIGLLQNGKTNNQTRIEYGSTVIDEPHGSESYNVLYPELSLSINPTEVYTDRYKENQRTITILNSGLGTASRVRFRITYQAGHQPVSLSLGATVLTPLSAVGLVREYELNFSDPIFSPLLTNGVLRQNQSFQLIEKYKGTTCSYLPTHFELDWGCATLQTPLVVASCYEGGNKPDQYGYTSIVDGEPNFSRAQGGFSRSFTRRTTFCGNNTAQLELTYTNLGNSNTPASVDGARDVTLSFYHSEFYTYSNFRVKDLNGNWVSIPGAPSSSSFGSFVLSFGTLTGTVLADLDSDGLFNDLPPGASLTFAMDFTAVCPSTFSTCGGNTSNNVFSTFLNYKDNCGTSRTFTDTDVNTYLWERTASNYVNTLQSYTIEGPVDLSELKTEVYTFTTSRRIEEADFLDCSAGSFYSVLQVPVGYKVESALWNGVPISFTQSAPGADVTLLGGGYSGNYQVEFSLDCDGQSSGDPVGYLTWNMFHRCDPSCACEQKLVCGSYEVFNHCPECTGFHTKSFTVERTTFGQVMPPYRSYTHADLATAPLVDRTTPGIRLDRVYELDEFVAEATGIFDSVATGSYAHNKVFYEVRYTSPINVNILDVLSVEFVVDNGTVQTYTGTPIAPVALGSRVYAFDFQLPGTGTIVPGDKIDVKIRFKVRREAALLVGMYQLQRFRANLYGVDTNDEKQGCESYGAVLSVLKGRSWLGSSSSSWRCDGLWDPTLLWIQSGSGGDDFPNEFRPLGYLEQMSVKLPAGYQYIPGSGEFVYYSYGHYARPVEDPANPPTIIPNATGDIVVFPRASFWEVSETVSGPSTWIAMLRLNIEPKCSVAPVCSPTPVYGPPFQQTRFAVATMTSANIFVTYAYSPTGQITNTTNTSVNGTNLRRADLNLAASGLKDGYEPTVSWPIQLCNNTSGNNSYSANTWIAFEPANVSTLPLSVRNIDNNTLYAGSDVKFYGPTGKGYMMIRIGEIPLNQCRNLEFTVGYENCVEDKIDTIRVTASGGCSALRFPLVEGHTGKICTQIRDCEQAVRTSILQLRYRKADYQWTVHRPGAAKVNLCENIPFEITLTSTQIADMTDVYAGLKLPPGLSYVSGSGTYTGPM
jgi:hypothetical protein